MNVCITGFKVDAIFFKRTANNESKIKNFVKNIKNESNKLMLKDEKYVDEINNLKKIYGDDFSIYKFKNYEKHIDHLRNIILFDNIEKFKIENNYYEKVIQIRELDWMYEYSYSCFFFENEHYKSDYYKKINNYDEKIFKFYEQKKIEFLNAEKKFNELRITFDNDYQKIKNKYSSYYKIGTLTYNNDNNKVHGKINFEHQNY